MHVNIYRMHVGMLCLVLFRRTCTNLQKHALYKLIISLLPLEPSCKLYVMSATSSLATKPPIVTGTVY